jgi:hypothetical protein
MTGVEIYAVVLCLYMRGCGAERRRPGGVRWLYFQFYSNIFILVFGKISFIFHVLCLRGAAVWIGAVKRVVNSIFWFFCVGILEGTRRAAWGGFGALFCERRRSGGLKRSVV